MTKLGGWVPEYELGSQRSKSKVTRDKNDKVWHFFGAVLVGAVLGGRGRALLAVYIWETSSA